MGEHGLITAAIIGFAAVSTVVLTGVGIRYRREQGARWFAATMAWVSLWLCSVLAVLLVDHLPTEGLLYMAGLSFSQTTPAFWFCFVLAYTGHERWLRAHRVALLFALPLAIVVSIWTNPLHGLYLAGITEVSIGANATWISAQPGPAAFIGFLYASGLFVVGLWLVVRMLSAHDRLFSGQAVWLLCGSLAPIAFVVTDVAGLSPTAEPWTSMGFAVTGIAYGYGLFRHRLLDLTPAARRIGVREAFDDFADGVVILDRDRDIVAINRNARRQFDCELDAVLGEPVSTIDPALASITGSDEVVDIERGRRILEVSTSAVEDSRDRHTGDTLSVRDVTERRHRKQRLEVLNRVLRHNLRNDMTIVKGYAEELSSENDSDRAEAIVARSSELLGRAKKAREIEQVLSGRQQSTELDVGGLVDAVVTAIEEEYPDRSITVSVPDDLRVVTDSATLELILENLVENAVEHGTPSTANGTVEITATRSGDGIEIAVSDAGPGIPQNEIDVLAAATESALEHSSGLGLWLVYWGSARLGGRLTFETDDGTTVRLSIPGPDQRTGSSPSPITQ